MPKNRKDVHVALFGSLKIMVMSAIFVALSIVCGKYLKIPVGDIMRFSFENLPVLMAGIAFGPIVGGVVGVAADLIGCVLVGYAINPVVTVGAAVIGVGGGVMFRVLKRLPLFPRTLIAVVTPHIVGSVVIKTIGLAAFYSMPLWELMLWRLLNYAVVATLEVILIYMLLKNKAVRKQLMIDLGGRA